jgi:ribosomal protein S18 acetylase RimI-like enzyme
MSIMVVHLPAALPISGYAAVLAGVEIRRCETRDLPGVLELWEKEASEHASTPDRIEDLERLVADSPAALLVAEQNGEVVGALIAAWDGWRGNMYRLAVKSSHRRTGVATALTRAGEDYLRSRGARRVTALIAHEDRVAGSFWDSAGYPLDPLMSRRVRNI